MTYQPAVGVWKDTPARRLLWAAKQVVLRLRYEKPEQDEIDKWSLKFEQELKKPVLKVDWKRYWRSLQKADGPDLPDELAEAWASLPESIRDELWKQAGEIRTSALGLPFDAADLEAGIESSMELIKGIPDSTRDRLRSLIRDALEDGAGQDGFAKRIRQEWPEVARRKAEQIAVTEWNRAASTATRVSYLKQGVESVRWFTAGDNRVCSICEGNAAEGDIPIKDGFPSGVDQPPAHPGCRCNISSA